MYMFGISVVIAVVFLLFLLRQLLAYMIGTLFVCLEVSLENIREEEKFDYSENDNHFDDDKKPQTPPYGHVSKALIIEIPYAFQSIQRLFKKCNHTHGIMSFQIKQRKLTLGSAYKDNKNIIFHISLR